MVLLSGAVETLTANVLINTTNLLLLGNAQLQQQLRILTWGPATARKNEKNTSFQLADSSDATFSLFLIHLFASDFLVPIIFFKVPVFH